MQANLSRAAAYRLDRRIGVTGGVLLGLGSMVGTGVFVGIAVAGGVAGPAVVVSIVLAAIVAVCNAASSAQLAATHPVSGGTYEYGYRFVHPIAGFLAGWMFLIAKGASAATAARTFAAYLLASIGVTGGGPAASPSATLVGIALLSVAVVTAIVALGIKPTTSVNAVIVTITVTALATLVVIVAPNVTTERFVPFFDPEPARRSPAATGYAAALVFVAFTGYGRVATLGEEIRDPARNIPRAIAATVSIVTLIYLTVTAAAIATIGAAKLATIARGGGAPLEQAALAAGGVTLQLTIVVAAMCATFGVLLNLLLGLSRVVLAMGRRGDVPRRLAYVATSGPVAAVVAVGMLVGGLVLVGDVRTTWSFSAITVLLYYAITNVAALRLPPAARRYPRWISAVGLIGCVLLGAAIDRSVLVPTAAVTIVGLVWFALAARLRRTGARR